MAPEGSQNKSPNDRTAPYRGRFAPSPTGPLHFGSLVAAAGSFLAARARGGSWHVRIEDIDPPREVAGAAREQILTLKRFGLVSDRPVSYQSTALARHLQAIEGLAARGLAFGCRCTRRNLLPGGVYPGTCRGGLPPGEQARSIRFRVPEAPVEFVDRVFGPRCHELVRECGDFVIRRADGLIAYQLAVVVDDAAEGITEVVRGADLLDSTARQIALYRALSLPEPAWLHLALVVDEHGEKLSKSTRADPVARYNPAEALRLALRALGHEPPRGHSSLEAQWRWAIANWQPERLPRRPVAVGMQPG